MSRGQPEPDSLLLFPPSLDTSCRRALIVSLPSPSSRLQKTVIVPCRLAPRPLSLTELAVRRSFPPVFVFFFIFFLCVCVKWFRNFLVSKSVCHVFQKCICQPLRPLQLPNLPLTSPCLLPPPPPVTPYITGRVFFLSSLSDLCSLLCLRQVVVCFAV